MLDGGGDWLLVLAPETQSVTDPEVESQSDLSRGRYESEFDNRNRSYHRFQLYWQFPFNRTLTSRLIDLGTFGGPASADISAPVINNRSVITGGADVIDTGGGLRQWASNSSSSAASPTRSAPNAPPSSDEPQNP
jgi:hypothetical protein